MNYGNPSNLGIIACPGGEVFANQIIRHLIKGHTRTFNRIVNDLSKRFELDRNVVIKRMRFNNEAAIILASSANSGCSEHYTHFKIPTRFSLFANGEVKADIQESIRGKDIYIVQDVENHYPLAMEGCAKHAVLSVNDHLMTLFVTVDAAREAGAGRITAVLPVYPYSRQHKKKGREGITAPRIGQVLEFLGVNRIITLDLHSRDIGNAFNRMILENLHASYQIIRELTRLPGILDNDFVVVAPDTGAVDRNKFYATTLKKPLALLYKERDYSRVSYDARDTNIENMKLLGDVHGKTVFMADDMLGTGGTLLKAMQYIREQGAKKVLAAISLPLFSGKAVQFFDEAYKEGFFYRIIGTNAVYQEEILKREWYRSVNITGLFAQVIARIHQNTSLSPLLDNRDIINKLLVERTE
ncbi:MAG: ribose-phosphate diphosphokinase [Treponema sp.]|jgi:ribose-phosphate pyrophosphokinase|nr:ribose-phosphate diphosphokinase [Treponema sp.]